MILDDGVCTVFQKNNVAAQGEKPRYEYKLLYSSMYGQLSLETVEADPTGYRKEVRVDARIRILQNRDVTLHNALILRDAHDILPGERLYEVVRAYHGFDDDSGQPITDLSLTEVGRWS